MTPAAMLPPEMRLLLTVARRDADGDEVLEAARGVRSWPLLLMLAERERAVGTLWRRLAPHAVALDGDGLAAMRRVALVEGFRGQRQRARLVAAVRALQGAGIPVMLLKGAALATTVYGSFEERAMADLDVLIRPSDGARALGALTDAGWRLDRERFPIDVYAGHHHLPPLEDSRHGSVVLEPHVSLFSEGSPFTLGIDELWRDAQGVRLDGVEALAPSPVHLAVHACVHLTWSHALADGGWRTLRDLRAILDVGGLSWDALVDGARRAGAETCCYWALALARATSVVDVPEEVLRALRPSLPAGLRAILARHFLLQLFSPDLRCPSTRLRRALWVLAVQPAGQGRPWSRNERFARSRSDTPARSAAQRASAWGSYLRVAVSGRAPARG